jgi:hypothetical protein
MPNPNILPIPAEFPHVQSLSKTAWRETELRRIVFQCGLLAMVRLDLYKSLIVGHPHTCLTCRDAVTAAEEGAEEERDFLVETVRALKSKGYTKEQILEAMEESHGA